MVTELKEKLEAQVTPASREETLERLGTIEQALSELHSNSAVPEEKLQVIQSQLDDIRSRMQGQQKNIEDTKKITLETYRCFKVMIDTLGSCRTDIDERPEIVELKERFGDLEIDTIIGKNHKGAILTINDRATSRVWIRKLSGKEAIPVAKIAVWALRKVKNLIHTITADNGKEFAKKIGKDTYRKHLAESKYGNNNLSQTEADFWNFGDFAISPKNQVEFVKSFYEEKLPFSKRNIDIVKNVMITEQNEEYTIRAKTGWTRENNINTGWWTGYIETKNGTYIFATRLLQDRKMKRSDFGSCRKEITKKVFKDLNII